LLPPPEKHLDFNDSNQTTDQKSIFEKGWHGKIPKSAWRGARDAWRVAKVISFIFGFFTPLRNESTVRNFGSLFLRAAASLTRERC
jgi:hypothetical protein